MRQNKEKEIEFFDRHAQADEYNVFSPASNEFLINTCLRLAGFRPSSKIVDLGCGSGIFSSILAGKHFWVTGVDISPVMIETANKKYPKKKYGVNFVVGDVEALPFADAEFDGVLLSGLLHHLPDPSACVREVYRILKPGGSFVAFDPNRMNPFMYLYRDRSSPFYSSKGVTENERPVLAKQLARPFREVGFETEINYLSNLQYRYIASRPMRFLLPVYNFVDSMVFSLPFLRSMRAFVILSGKKKQTPL